MQFILKRMLIAAGLAAASWLGLGAHADTISAADQVREMGRGVNILGYDPFWRYPERARFKASYFKLIHDGGFSTVRVNLQAFAHMDATGKLDPEWVKKLDWVVDNALVQQLNVILDDHDDCGNNPPACHDKLIAFWKQIAPRYKDRPSRVMFEILNEPNRALDPLWNTYLMDALAVIRETNPTRNVVIGPNFWNAVDHLGELVLPATDRHIIVTVHYYHPMEFTHQGASWVPQYKTLGITWGTQADRATLKAEFDGVAAWAKANDRPIFLGEFGAYDKGPLDSRVAYTSAVAREAEGRNWAWAYWQFDSDFVVYSVEKEAWNEPIYRALIPESH